MNSSPPEFIKQQLSIDEHVVLLLPPPSKFTLAKLLKKLAVIWGLLIAGVVYVFSQRAGDEYRVYLFLMINLSLLVASIVFFFRQSKTSHAITTKRILRFVSVRLVDGASLSSLEEPELFSYANNPSWLMRTPWRLFGFSPVIQFRRKRHLQVSLRSFVMSENPWSYDMGVPLLGVSLEPILDEVRSAWRMAQ